MGEPCGAEANVARSASGEDAIGAGTGAATGMGADGTTATGGAGGGGVLTDVSPVNGFLYSLWGFSTSIVLGL